MKTLYLECNMGAAGDMLMAALYELMAESEKHDFLETMNRLFPGVAIHSRREFVDLSSIGLTRSSSIGPWMSSRIRAEASGRRWRT